MQRIKSVVLVNDQDICFKSTRVSHNSGWSSFHSSGVLHRPCSQFYDCDVNGRAEKRRCHMRSIKYGCHVRGEIQCVDQRRRQSRSFNWFTFHNVCWIGILHSPGMFTCSMFYQKQSKYVSDPVCVGQREDFVWKCGFLEDVLCLFSRSRCPDMLWLCLEHLWIS